MKRADIALGHTAADMQLGEPSPAEVELGAYSPSARELAEDFLYFHLTVAMRCTVRLDGAQRVEFRRDLERQREKALEAAQVRFRELAEHGGVPRHLVEMASAVELNP